MFLRANQSSQYPQIFSFSVLFDRATTENFITSPRLRRVRQSYVFSFRSAVENFYHFSFFKLVERQNQKSTTKEKTKLFFKEKRKKNLKTVLVRKVYFYNKFGIFNNR